MICTHPNCYLIYAPALLFGGAAETGFFNGVPHSTGPSIGAWHNPTNDRVNLQCRRKELVEWLALYWSGAVHASREFSISIVSCTLLYVEVAVQPNDRETCIP